MILANLLQSIYEKHSPTPKTPLPIVLKTFVSPLIAQTAVTQLAQLEKRVDSAITDLSHLVLDEMQRLKNQQQSIDSNQKTDELTQMMLMALQSGNIDLAMLIFASLETTQSHEITKVLSQKLLDAQNQRRNLTTQLANAQGDKNANNGQMTQIQGNMQEVNDTIQMLTTFLKDVQDQKNRTVEFANNFLNSEHQTTMSIVRGMR